MNRGLRVLVIEDSEDDTLFLLRELKRAGFEPTFERVDTAAAMAASLRRQPWDVIVSDHSMPGFGSLLGPMSGETAARLRLEYTPPYLLWDMMTRNLSPSPSTPFWPRRACHTCFRPLRSTARRTGTADIQGIRRWPPWCERCRIAT